MPATISSSTAMVAASDRSGCPTSTTSVEGDRTLSDQQTEVRSVLVDQCLPVQASGEPADHRHDSHRIHRDGAAPRSLRSHHDAGGRRAGRQGGPLPPSADKTDPYNEIEVSTNSVDNGQGHAGHTGSVFDFTSPASNSGWGDIIPPFEGFAGLNWTTAGQAAHGAHCAPGRHRALRETTRASDVG